MSACMVTFVIQRSRLAHMNTWSVMVATLLAVFATYMLSSHSGSSTQTQLQLRLWRS